MKLSARIWLSAFVAFYGWITFGVLEPIDKAYQCLLDRDDSCLLFGAIDESSQYYTHYDTPAVHGLLVMAHFVLSVIMLFLILVIIVDYINPALDKMDAAPKKK